MFGLQGEREARKIPLESIQSDLFFFLMHHLSVWGHIFSLSEPLIVRLVGKQLKTPKLSCKYIFAPKGFQSSKREVSCAMWLKRSDAKTASTQKMTASSRL